MAFELPRLPYAGDALEPHISAETLEYHHGKHHQAYIDKTNAAIEGTEWAEQPLEEIVRRAEGGLFDNAAQAFNHTFYFECLGPDGGGEPTGELAEALAATFGSVDAFRDLFSKAATSLFGSGWVWLVLDGNDQLSIRATANAGCPLKDGERPLLACDVWEHAYYIDRRNARPAYVEAFWNVVDWDAVARNHAGARGA